MADSYVCSGATMMCTMGDQSAKLTVLPSRTVFLCGQPMANISDHTSMANLAPFGKCRSLAYPATAAATAAALGTLTPMPCVHNTPMPWIGGKSDYLIKNQPALLKSCKCTCMWGGMISITDNGQKGEVAQWVQKLPKDTLDDTPKDALDDTKNRLLREYMSEMSRNNILSSSENPEKRLTDILNIINAYITREELKARSQLSVNLFSKRDNCTKDGYYIGERTINKDEPKWPEPYFEVGTMEIVIIPPGTILDRYSGEHGEFFGDTNSQLDNRCVPTELDDYKEHHQYKTREPLIAIKSKVAPSGFGQPGGAEQYELFFNTPTPSFFYRYKEDKKKNEEKKDYVFYSDKAHVLHRDKARELVEQGFFDQIPDTSPEQTTEQY